MARPIPQPTARLQHLRPVVLSSCSPEQTCGGNARTVPKRMARGCSASPKILARLAPILYGSLHRIARCRLDSLWEQLPSRLTCSRHAGKVELTYFATATADGANETLPSTYYDPVLDFT